MNSAWEHFFAATAVLASTGPIKQRLFDAYREHLDGLKDDELPKEIRDEFSTLTTTMCRVRPLRGETSLQATVRKMSDIEAGRAATHIVNMLATISRIHGTQRPKLRAVNSGGDD